MMRRAHAKKIIGSLLVAIFLLMSNPAGADEVVSYTPPYPSKGSHPFVETECTGFLFIALPNTCYPEGQAKPQDGSLTARAKNISPDDGTLPGGSQTYVYTGFIFNPPLTHSASSVTVTFHYTISHASVETQGMTHGWGEGDAEVVAWAEQFDYPSTLKTEVDKVVDSRDGRTEVVKSSRSLAVTLVPQEGGIPAGPLNFEISLQAAAVLSGGPTMFPGDTGWVDTKATLTVDSISVTAVP